ncbi:uncharacterized protein LOC118736139 [Rhagoletis pomonella]|uniref:uncharacterized protein LOC118736139 n=1 Tax=Rhagoletis pomonella TaxID=28610 RepID=UPI001783C7FD|nr:uncharacterized protein LOC118736139 [Rhagoletis pomonella]
MPNEDSEELYTASLKIAKITLEANDWVYSMQKQDDRVREIISKVTSAGKGESDEYTVQNGRLYRKEKNKKLWVVPNAMRYKIIQNVHEKVKHLGVEKTIEETQKYFWFPRMRNFVKSFIKTCIECAYNKQLSGRKEGEYHHYEMEPVPFKTVHLDHLGPFPKSKKRNEHVLVFVDAFTKFTIVKGVRSTATRYVIELLNENKLILALHHDEVMSNEQLSEVQTEAAERVNSQRIKAKKMFDEKHSSPTQYTVGNLVLAENEPACTRSSRKLEPPYKGPFIITKLTDIAAPEENSDNSSAESLLDSTIANIPDNEGATGAQSPQPQVNLSETKLATLLQIISFLRQSVDELRQETGHSREEMKELRARIESEARNDIQNAELPLSQPSMTPQPQLKQKKNDANKINPLVSFF